MPVVRKFLQQSSSRKYFALCNRFLIKTIILSSNSQYFNKTTVNFHDLRCDVLMTSPTDLRTLSKYIEEYSFTFPLVQEMLNFVKNHGSYTQNKVTRFYGPRRSSVLCRPKPTVEQSPDLETMTFDLMC